MTATASKPPKFDLNCVPRMQIGMGDEAAYQNGYRHGYQAVCTTHICSLTKGTSEHKAWMRGYYDGGTDSGKE
jgi:hypothetical protein